MSDFTYVDASKMKCLEEYAVALITGMVSIQTMESFHVQALKKGLIKDDLDETAQTIMWELKRLLSLYKHQCEHVLELVPDDFNFKPTIEALKKVGAAKAKKTAKEMKE